ncbi:MAG: transcriptional repressor [Spirochaetes bacterium]|nr:transcriptional repressor [Spirochaetota bacterium]
MAQHDFFGHMWWHGRLRGHGYRITVPRQVILDVLHSREGHLSAEDIYIEVRKEYPQIGLTTVYRTLELLVRMGIVFKFDFGDGRSRYELSEGPEGFRHHHHLVCSVCGRVIDYSEYLDSEQQLLDKTEAGLSEKYGFKITNHLIRFYGLCDRCQSGE